MLDNFGNSDNDNGNDNDNVDGGIPPFFPPRPPPPPPPSPFIPNLLSNLLLLLSPPNFNGQFFPEQKPAPPPAQLAELTLQKEEERPVVFSEKLNNLFPEAENIIENEKVNKLNELKNLKKKNSY